MLSAHKSVLLLISPRGQCGPFSLFCDLVQSKRDELSLPGCQRKPTPSEARPARGEQHKNQIRYLCNLTEDVCTQLKYNVKRQRIG